MSTSAKEQAEANILTFLRVKPSKNSSGYFVQDELEKGSLMFNLPNNFKADYVNNSKLKHAYHFNGILEPTCTQDDVFKKVGTSAVKNALDGFNSTIFAYGQTGSGKTYTLTGGPEKYADRGIIPRAISMIYNEARQRSDLQFKAYISYLELYNETGYDLLDPSHETKALEDLPKVSILEDEHGNFHLKNLSLHAAETEEDALNLLFMGDTNRAIAETPMNMASSRSHCIFSISLESRVVGSDKVRRSKLHLVDLAGSERVAKTNSSGSVLTEARYINSSLFFLEMVIVALYEKATKGRSHIPYRNSMMTSVLRDSLGGNCKTIMIATINPEARHTEESLSTCKFAQRVSLIKNKALINEEQDPSVMIRRLKNEVLTLREEISFLKGEAGEGDVLTAQELEELKSQCRSYCDDLDPHSTLNVGALSLTKIKDVFAIMKNLVLESRQQQPQQLGASGSSYGGGSNVTDAAAQGEIDNLQSLLVQRDSEIAILVNMVKQGKTIEDVGSAVQRSASSSRNQPRFDSAASDTSISTSASTTPSKTTAGNRSSSSNGRSVQEIQELQHQQREKQKEERIVKRHLFGVPPPEDKAVFDDASASFEWFRERCSLNASLEENKELLKSKITEAKTMGERANQSRNTINYLKNSIEAIRRERVMQKLSSGAKDSSSSSGEGAGSGDQKEEEEGEEKESEEETTYRRAIDQEKVVYKESFEKLRVLKPEIEHIRKIIEKCRGNMQNQFDQWYSNLHARGGMIAAQTAAHTSGYQQQQSDGNSIASDFTSSTSRYPVGAVRINAAAAAASFDSAADAKDVSSLGSSSLRDSYDYSGAQIDLKASSGVRRGSGSSQSTMMDNYRQQPVADQKAVSDDVNEDIMAFYQAKEELMKMKAAGGR